MSCDEIQGELVGFHFGETEPALRTRVEEHLRACPACLGDFLALKREIETTDGALGPSAAARARLRRAVAEEIGLRAAARPWSWWERPAAFVAAGATVLAALLVLHAVSTGRPSGPRSLAEPPAIHQPAE